MKFKSVLFSLVATVSLSSCGRDNSAAQQSNLDDIVSSSASEAGYIKVVKLEAMGSEGEIVHNYAFRWCAYNGAFEADGCEQMGARKFYPASELALAKYKKLGTALVQILALPVEGAMASAAASKKVVTAAVISVKKAAEYVLSEKETDYETSDNVLNVYLYKFRNYLVKTYTNIEDAVKGKYNPENEKFSNNGTYGSLAWLINKLNPLGSINKSKLFSSRALDGTLVTDDIDNIKAQLEVELAKIDEQ